MELMVLIKKRQHHGYCRLICIFRKRYAALHSSFSCHPLLILFAPSPHRVMDDLKTLSRLCQRVFDSWRDLRIDLTVHQTALLHDSQVLGQHLL